MTKKETALVASAGICTLVGIAAFYDQAPRYADSPMNAVMTSVHEELPVILPVQETVLPPLMDTLDAFVFASSVEEVAAPLPEIVFDNTLPEILPPLTELELPPLEGEV